MLVVDEVYRGIAVGGAVQPPAASLAANAVTVGGLSKVCGLAGLRIGWTVGPALLVDDVRGYHAAASRCPAADARRWPSLRSSTSRSFCGARATSCTTTSSTSRR